MQEAGATGVEGAIQAVTEAPPTEYVSRLDAMSLEDTETTGASLGTRIVQSWKDMRGHTRGLIEEGMSEHRLLFYVMLSDIIFFVSFSIRTVVAPSAVAKDMIVGLEIGKWLVIALLIRTTCMYILSAILVVVSKNFGGTGTWKETRIGVFWGALVAAPFGLLLAALSGMIHLYEADYAFLSSAWVSMPILWIGAVPFLWFISQGLAEAQGFARNSIAFLAMSVGAIVGLVALIYLRSAGLI